MSSVSWVRFLPEPADFQIHYNGPEDITIDYTAESPYECGKYQVILKTVFVKCIINPYRFFCWLKAEIVAKLKYIMAMARRK